MYYILCFPDLFGGILKVDYDFLYSTIFVLHPKAKKLQKATATGMINTVKYGCIVRVRVHKFSVRGIHACGMLRKCINYTVTIYFN